MLSRSRDSLFGSEAAVRKVRQSRRFGFLFGGAQGSASYRLRGREVLDSALCRIMHAPQPSHWEIAITCCLMGWRDLALLRRHR